MSRLKFSLFFLLLLASVALAGCAGTQPMPTPSDADVATALAQTADVALVRVQLCTPDGDNWHCALTVRRGSGTPEMAMALVWFADVPGHPWRAYLDSRGQP